MSLRSTLRLFTTTRRVLRTLDRIADAEIAQARALQRLADQFAPLPQISTTEDLKQTGATFSKDDEQGRIQDYVERCERELKKTPTEEEIVRYLDGEEVRL